MRATGVEEVESASRAKRMRANEPARGGRGDHGRGLDPQDSEYMARAQDGESDGFVFRHDGAGTGTGNTDAY